MKKLISTKAYGVGNWTGYDPRFPGYFSGTFWIKGRLKEINNITSRDIYYVTETEECKALTYKYLGPSNDSPYNYIELKEGESYNLNKKHYFQEQVSVDIVYNDQYTISGTSIWWDENDVSEVFDINNKFTKFNYNATNNQMDRI